MSWTPERIEELKKLWDQGHSASVIGKMLGVSKNAVVGKAHRMKLESRPSPIKRDGESTPRKVRRKQAAAKAAIVKAMSATRTAASNGTAPSSKTVAKNLPRAQGPAIRNGVSHAVAPATPAVAAVSHAKAQRTPQAGGRGPKCLWPIGDPGDKDFHFCGAPALHGKPYCAEHCARAYITRSRSDSAASRSDSAAA